MSEQPVTPNVPDSKDPDERLFDLPADADTSHTRGLIERAQHGDVEALNLLFKTYYDLMLELARKRLGTRLRGKEEADDLAQTTFREATRDFHAYVYRGEGSLLRWLVRILQNKIRDRAEFYAARKRDISREHSLDETSRDDPELPRVPEPAAREVPVARAAERHEEDRILREALSRLSPEHRQAITLVFFEGRQLKEAGQLMGGRTEDAVRMLLRRAEKNLYDLIRTRVDALEE
ncbi:MAG: sigma-70 family RNA polymerase sigma factor [Planctomycetes bacterium]|nr:sigma-70 family RNA polymerase sigma factor [Planctomycetota bacterium]